jgi:hypothetical protein
VTEEIHELLPDLSLEQCEDLKRSHIYEVLSEDDSKNSVCIRAMNSWTGITNTSGLA